MSKFHKTAVFLLAGFILAFGIWQTSPTKAQAVDVLVCVYDMGDTGPLERVSAQLSQQKISYKVVAIGKAAEKLKGSDSIVSLTDMKPDETITWPREKLLSEQTLKDLSTQYQPKVVVAGMAAACQAQLLNHFKKAQGASTIAFYDNFDPITTKEYVQPFLKEIGKIDTYLIPAQATLKSFQAHEKTKSSNLEVVGQPMLEEWDEIFKTTNREDLCKKIGLAPSDQVILFVGGYDDTYREYFSRFVQGTQKLAGHKDLKFLVTYHPKTDGSLEKGVIAEQKATNIQVVDKGGPSSTQLATLAKILVCHKSGMGMQALYKGLSVLYVVQKGTYPNFALEQGWVQQAETANEVAQTLEHLLAAANSNKPDVKDLGVPTDATLTIVRKIKEHLEK
ncbi:hypothetical protein [Candidatus Finniella inopinata]|uniref:UDP-N-acetylglucosamine 2-epimerase domain-containing protein n=1 Tax=Candidatus Finniella inopinata TaxID=1696036 RepID=A0A4Q7DHV7_9PROT|nr:hypothetical protein [Candidatus Finniella inopinata]RZI46531.1 hypothetical protein EQU50_02795 [Candidatus Finniella inopinata]